MDKNSIVIDVSDATVRFNRASQQVNNLKEYMIKMLKRELMFQEFFALKDVNMQVNCRYERFWKIDVAKINMQNFKALLWERLYRRENSSLD